jgi:hypothetical protein
MRKRITPAISVDTALESERWMNLEGLAEIEVTSEDPAHPVESALLPGGGGGWRAAQKGRQNIRIVFDSPQDIQTIHLVFTEEHEARTQEFVLRWASSSRTSLKEIVRQQYNFTPVSSEVERYNVEIKGAQVLELEIIPSIAGESYASLTELRLR